MTKMEINEKLRANLPAVVVVGMILGAFQAGWAASAFGARLDAIESSRFSMHDAVEQAWRTAMANPGLRVADPREPEQFFVVEKSGG